MSRRYVSRERLVRLDAELTPRDHDLVHVVGLLRLVSGRQLLSLVWPDATEADARAARRALVRLTRARVLARLDRRVGGLGRGSDAYTYALDTGGQRLLAPGKARRPRLPSPAMWRHVLAGSESYVRLAEGLRTSGRVLDEWQGEPECWRRFSAPDGSLARLKPDAFVRVAGLGYTDVTFLETDTGSQSPAVIRAKLASYRAYAMTGAEQAREGVFPRVVFVVPDPRRQDVIVTLLAEQDPDWWPVFAVGQAADVARLLGGVT